MDIIESRTLYCDENVTVMGDLSEDSDTRPEEFDCYTETDLQMWRTDRWRYVNLDIRVLVRGANIGSDSLSGIHHGDLESVSPDAWDSVPVISGEGFNEARQWLISIGAPTTILDGVSAWLKK